MGHFVSYWLCLLIVAVIAANAQTNHTAPLPATGMAYTKYKNKFYINGGTIKAGTGPDTLTGQFFALDLSKPWRSTSPAWIPLPEGPKKDFTPGVMSLDGKIFMTFPSIGFPAYRFSFESNTWGASKANFRGTMYDVDAVTMGTNGKVIIVGGFQENATYSPYDIYSFDTDQTVTMNLPNTGAGGSAILPGRRDYRVVWSEHLKSAVFYGGFSPFQSPDIVSFYHPESKQWSSMKTTGLNRNYTYHCMAATDDGKKLLSYGGQYANPNNPNAPSVGSDLHILDLTSGKWTEGASVLAKRLLSACTIAGDYFLLWGGQTGRLGGPLNVSTIVDVGKPSTPVMIYSISQNGWVDEYKPSPEYLDSTPTPSSGPSASTAPTSPSSSSTPGSSSDQAPGSKTNIGAIAGGAAAAAIVIIAIGFLLWRCSKQGKGRSKQQRGPSSKGDHLASALHDARKMATHDTREVPPSLSTLEDSPISYYTDTFGNASDGHYNDRHNNRRAAIPGNPTSASMSPAVVAPHYPSWGANFNSDYAIESQTFGTYVPPPPPGPPVPPGSMGHRNPQALGHGLVMEPSYASYREDREKRRAPHSSPRYQHY